MYICGGICYGICDGIRDGIRDDICDDISHGICDGIRDGICDGIRDDRGRYLRSFFSVNTSQLCGKVVLTVLGTVYLGLFKDG